jgi:hypothetical protein
LPVTIIVAIFQGWRSKPIKEQPERQRGSWPLKKILVYLIFLICFPLSLTPSAEVGSRWFAGVIAVVLFIAIQAA